MQKHNYDQTFDYSGSKHNRSLGHLEFIGEYEFYQSGDDIYQAHYSNVLDISTRQRIGRFCCKVSQAEQVLERLRTCISNL